MFNFINVFPKSCRFFESLVVISSSQIAELELGAPKEFTISLHFRNNSSTKKVVHCFQKL